MAFWWIHLLTLCLINESWFVFGLFPIKICLFITAIFIDVHYVLLLNESRFNKLRNYEDSLHFSFYILRVILQFYYSTTAIVAAVTVGVGCHSHYYSKGTWLANRIAWITKTRTLFITVCYLITAKYYFTKWTRLDRNLEKTS